MQEDRHHVKKRGSRAEETGHQVRQPSQEDGEAEGAGEEAEWKEEMSHAASRMDTHRRRGVDRRDRIDLTARAVNSLVRQAAR